MSEKLEGLRALKSALVWNNNPGLRAEFRGNHVDYFALLRGRAEGRSPRHDRLAGEIVSLDAELPAAGDGRLIDDRAAKVWDTSQALQREFGRFHAFLTYVHALNGAREAE